jgi:hypothetical protein
MEVAHSPNLSDDPYVPSRGQVNAALWRFLIGSLGVTIATCVQIHHKASNCLQVAHSIPARPEVRPPPITLSFRFPAPLLARRLPLIFLVAVSLRPSQLFKITRKISPSFCALPFRPRLSFSSESVKMSLAQQPRNLRQGFRASTMPPAHTSPPLAPRPPTRTATGWSFRSKALTTTIQPQPQSQEKIVQQFFPVYGLEWQALKGWLEREFPGRKFEEKVCWRPRGLSYLKVFC